MTAHVCRGSLCAAARQRFHISIHAVDRRQRLFKQRFVGAFFSRGIAKARGREMTLRDL
jgi:hypothetical protein